MEENKAVRDELFIDESGINLQNIFNVQSLKEQGVTNIFSFIEGYHDAKADKDFNQTSLSYTKGYKYGKTGKF